MGVLRAGSGDSCTRQASGVASNVRCEVCGSARTVVSDHSQSPRYSDHSAACLAFRVVFQTVVFPSRDASYRAVHVVPWSSFPPITLSRAARAGSPAPAAAIGDSHTTRARSQCHVRTSEPPCMLCSGTPALRRGYLFSPALAPHDTDTIHTACESRTRSESEEVVRAGNTLWSPGRETRVEARGSG